jgi:hypothetical protein
MTERVANSSRKEIEMKEAMKKTVEKRAFSMETYMTK